MKRPVLRAEALITNECKTEVLVQCDLEESFYRLPGGKIDFGETAVEAIKRELLEEYDLTVKLGNLASINESIITYDGENLHQCTLIHWGNAGKGQVTTHLIHKENPGVKLTWRTIEQLRRRPTYPEGILDVITSKAEQNISHIIVRETYT